VTEYVVGTYVTEYVRSADPNLATENPGTNKDGFQTDYWYFFGNDFAFDGLYLYRHIYLVSVGIQHSQPQNPPQQLYTLDGYNVEYYYPVYYDSRAFQTSVDFATANYAAVHLALSLAGLTFAPEISILLTISDIVTAPGDITTWLGLIDDRLGLFGLYQDAQAILSAYDPFDPNYQDQYLPTFTAIAPIPKNDAVSQPLTDEVNSTVEYASKIAAYLQAVVVSENRYNSAIQMGDTASADLQNSAINNYWSLALAELNAYGEALTKLATDFQSAGLDLTFTAQDVTDFFNRIQSQGFAGLASKFAGCLECPGRRRDDGSNHSQRTSYGGPDAGSTVDGSCIAGRRRRRQEFHPQY
jgi:hypothetical protein